MSSFRTQEENFADRQRWRRTVGLRHFGRQIANGTPKRPVDNWIDNLRKLAIRLA